MSVGARWAERRSSRPRHIDDARDNDELDYARVVHSGSFRRLQGKTQILSLGDDDFYRTRLTHSLEVAQVAEGILQHLRVGGRGDGASLPGSSQVRAIGLAHDIGHPPFGHGGELALNYCMRNAGGFEGNAQTLRLLARLESYSAEYGADLTRRTLLGVLKYPVLREAALNPAISPKMLEQPTTIEILDGASAKPAKAIYDCDRDILEWILDPLRDKDRDLFAATDEHASRHGKTKHKSLDCSIMDAADDIAYGVHDLEDAAALNLIDEGDFRSALLPELCTPLISSLGARPLEGVVASYDGAIAALFGKGGVRKRLIGRLVHICISGTQIVEVDGFESPLLKHRVVMHEEPRALLDALLKVISTTVIQGARVQHLDFKGQRMVLACFEAMMSAPQRLLPAAIFARFEDYGGDLRVVSDHLACLTDAGLLRLYDRLFSPRMGTIFDRL